VEEVDMIIGMTGARDGMTEEQKKTFARGIAHFKATTLHHGDCIGADADAHDIASAEGLSITIHPPEDDKLRAFKREEGDQEHEPLGYFVRNRNIVNDSEILIGFPKTYFETKGGTWYTINYGKRQGKPVYVVLPDGSVDRFNIPE
jgi:hypothetical protein